MKPNRTPEVKRFPISNSQFWIGLIDYADSMRGLRCLECNIHAPGPKGRRLSQLRAKGPGLETVDDGAPKRATQKSVAAVGRPPHSSPVRSGCFFPMLLQLHLQFAALCREAATP